MCVVVHNTQFGMFCFSVGTSNNRIGNRIGEQGKYSPK